MDWFYNGLTIAGAFIVSIIVIAAIVAAVAMASRTPTGRATGGRGAYFAAWRARLPAGMPNTDFLRTPETYTILTVFVFLEFSLWLVDLARWHHLIYLAGVLLISAVQKYVPTGRRVAAYGMMFAAFTILGLYPWLHCNEDCKLKKQEAVQVEAQKAAAAAAREEQNRTAVQAARLEALKPAESPECSGVVSTTPMPLDTEWHVFMQQCDKTWAVVDNTGKQLPDAAVEFDPPYGIPNRVRMKTGSGGLYTMDCPRGFGPSAKVWKCKPQGSYSDTRQASLTFGVYYK